MTVTDLDQLVAKMAAEMRGPVAKVSSTLDTPKTATTWVPTPILERLDAADAVPYPAIYYRDDGRGILYPGLVHTVIGTPEAGKTMLCIAAAHAVLRAGQSVVFLDFEMSESSVVARLRAFGTTDVELGDFLYARPEEPVIPAQATLEQIAALRPALVVIDSMNVALGVEGLEPNSTPEVTLWVQRVARYLATHSGAAVLYPDHVTKNGETRGRWAFGSQAKAAAVDVVIAMNNETPFGKGRVGRSSLTVMKDRHGDLRGIALNGKTLASFVLTSADDGTLAAELHAPVDSAEFRPTFLMERVSRFLEDELEPQGSNAIVRGVTGKAAYVRQALGLLVDDGHVVREPGSGGRTLHRIVTQYREAPRPDRVPAEDGADTDDRVPAHSDDSLDAATPNGDRVPRPDRVPTASRRAPGDRVPVSPPLIGGERDADPVDSLLDSFDAEVVEDDGGAF